jgi:hypothetical protein
MPLLPAPPLDFGINAYQISAVPNFVPAPD